MDFDFTTLATQSDAALKELASKVNEALAEIFAAVPEDQAPTREQAELATSLDEGLTGLNAELATRKATADAFAASRAKFTTVAENQVEEAEVEVVEPEAEVVEPEVAPVVEPEVAVAPVAKVEPKAKTKENSVDTQALRGLRPSVPGRNDRRATMTAATDVPNAASGSEIRDMTHLAELAVEKARTFPTPDGTGFSQDFRRFGLAQISKNIPADLKIADGMSRTQVQDVLDRAVDEKVLPGGNLSAAAGWCSPSEVVYDLAEGETVEGMLSIPEVGLPRGGIKYTLGPDWADITGNAEFAMTEAQAIAGSYTKPSFEIPCPTFIESRLDAAGLFVKVPLLLEASYPELVARWMRGLMVSHEHIMNGKYIAGVVAALGSATAFPLFDMGSTAASLFDIIAFVAERERSKRKWSFSQSMEIVLPHWVLEALRADISNRTGRPNSSVKDAEIMALFTERRYAPQWVLDWQELAANAVGYPPTFDVLIYKAGTFVKGTSDVIKIQSVYDAASLASNIYTALFFEEGWNVMRMANGGVRATIPVCIAGRQGALNVVACGVTA